jgi:hypothetical protein
LVQKIEPVEDTRVLIKSCTILSTINYSLSFSVDFVEDTLQDIFVYLDVGVDDAGPVQDYVCEVGAEFLKIDIPTLAHIHQTEAELITFTGRTVAHYVHDASKLI